MSHQSGSAGISSAPEGITNNRHIGSSRPGKGVDVVLVGLQEGLATEDNRQNKQTKLAMDARIPWQMSTEVLLPAEVFSGDLLSGAVSMFSHNYARDIQFGDPLHTHLARAHQSCVSRIFSIRTFRKFVSWIVSVRTF